MLPVVAEYAGLPALLPWVEFRKETCTSPFYPNTARKSDRTFLALDTAPLEDVVVSFVRCGLYLFEQLIDPGIGVFPLVGELSLL